VPFRHSASDRKEPTGGQSDVPVAGVSRAISLLPSGNSIRAGTPALTFVRGLSMAKMHWDRVAREELDRLLVFDTTGWNGSGTFVVTVTDSNNRTHGRIHSSDHHHRQRCTWQNMRHTA
jgi:hypothetical protein